MYMGILPFGWAQQTQEKAHRGAALLVYLCDKDFAQPIT